MKTYKYSCDMGTICIKAGNVKQFFSNGYGDGQHTVAVVKESETNDLSDYNFKGHFEVLKNGIAELLDYDCGNNAKTIHRFSEGRYPVYNNNGNVYIGEWRGH